MTSQEIDRELARIQQELHRMQRERERQKAALRRKLEDVRESSKWDDWDTDGKRCLLRATGTRSLYRTGRQCGALKEYQASSRLLRTIWLTDREVEELRVAIW